VYDAWLEGGEFEVSFFLFGFFEADVAEVMSQ
jgi:hypothetical protein